ncbi:MAG: retroviral-like aspartic protease family protein [Alistipes sp.]|jgi:predicted aspartyl protease|nr:retroviral-like aspartic protease family protein [Alistipes sp.]
MRRLLVILLLAPLQLWALWAQQTPGGSTQMASTQVVSPPVVSTQVAEVPFRWDGHAIVMTLRLNDSHRELSFMLDTGADGMAIRKTLADSLGIKPNYAQNARVVGGTTQVYISAGNSVHLTDSLTLTGQNMAIFDDVRHGMDGIIGLNLVKNFITKIDFDRQKISFHTFGDRRRDEGEIAVPLRMHGNLMTVPSVLSLTGDTACRGYFLFDTGADYKLIVFSDFVEGQGLLESGWKPEAMGTTVSLGHSTPVYHGTASGLTVGYIEVENVAVTLQAAGLAGSLPGNSVDGSIGVQFWAGYNVTIDLSKKEIYLSSRE